MTTAQEIISKIKKAMQGDAKEMADIMRICTILRTDVIDELIEEIKREDS